MSVTTDAWIYVKENYNTLDIGQGAATTCTPGTEALPATNDEIIDGNGDVVTVIPGLFVAYRDFHGVCSAMTTRGPGYYGGNGPNMLERGCRMVHLTFAWPDDAATVSSTPVGNQVALTRADVIDEIDPAVIEAEAPPNLQFGYVNYRGARNSLGELIDP